MRASHPEHMHLRAPFPPLATPAPHWQLWPCTLSHTRICSCTHNTLIRTLSCMHTHSRSHECKQTLQNAHCVEHAASLKVKRRGSDQKYVAHVVSSGAECDVALLSVEDPTFFQGVEPVRFGELPSLQVQRLPGFSHDCSQPDFARQCP